MSDDRLHQPTEPPPHEAPLPHDEGDEEEEEESVAWSDVALIFFVATGIALNLTGVFTQIFGVDTCAILTFVGGYGIFWDSLTRLARGKLGGDLAVTIAAFAALAIGEYVAAAEVILIMLIGTALESFAVGRTRGAIAALLRLVPERATVLRDGEPVTLPVRAVQPGDRVIVRPGERIPVDGIVLAGASTVDQAALTGESQPVDKQPGDRVFTGTINLLGRLEIEATAVGEQTTLAEVIRLVEQAEARKAPVQRLADRWAEYFVPTVVALGIATFVLWWLILGRSPAEAARKMAAALIIACPCALILATPTGIAAAIGRAARRGILTKGGVFLEAIGGIDCFVFDKTGTLTTGEPVVASVVPVGGVAAAEVLRVAAAVEQGASHPIAAAIAAAAQRDAAGVLPTATEFEFRPGRGVAAQIDGAPALAGNARLLQEMGVPLPDPIRAEIERLQHAGQTPVLVAHGGRLLGLLGIEDRLRPEAAAAIAGLKALGIRHTVMLTGDAEPVARAVAERAGLDAWEANLLPAEKAERIRALQQAGYRVAMLGDGINDAPALTQADVGIAMGKTGSHIAVEAADLVVMREDLAALPEAVVISRRALRLIRFNIWAFAVGLNGAGVLVSMAGLISPVVAAFEHQIASLLVVCNSLRPLAGGRAWQPGMSLPVPGTDKRRGEAWLARLADSPLGRRVATWPATARQWLTNHRGALRKTVLAAAALAWLGTSLYTVPAGEAVVVRRLGTMAGTAGPGLHLGLPWPIDRRTRVATDRVREVTIGFRRERIASPGDATTYEWNTPHLAGEIRRAPEEALMLTGDEYLVEALLSVQYRVASAAQYVLAARDPEALLRAAAETVLRQQVGHRPLEQVLTVGRAELEATIGRETQALLDRHRCGIAVVAARLIDIHPPLDVVAAYREVASAFEEKGRKINEAEAYQNETVPRARGQAAAEVEMAHGYTHERVHRARGDAARFLASLAGYRAGPVINRLRLYLEAIEAALAPPEKFVVDPRAGGRRQMWLVDGQPAPLFPGDLPPGAGAPQSDGSEED